MSLVSGSIPNLVNGISQQPYSVRLASQAEAQENALSSPVEGLGKRPPTVHRANIPGADWDDAFLHLINRDSEEQYIVVIADGDLRVFDLDGNEQTVLFPEGKDYLNEASPSTVFKAVTVADFTFVLNRNVTVEKDPEKTPEFSGFEGLVWVRQGEYSSTYRVGLTDLGDVTRTTLDASNAANASNIQTNAIAEDLSNSINGNNGYTTVRPNSGSVIHVTRSTDFDLFVSDSQGETAMEAIKGYIQSFSNLPARNAPEGFKIAIRGNFNNAFDDYWVEYDGEVWNETIAPGEEFKFKKETLPWTLIRTETGDFEFKPGEWEDRKVGALEKVPFPSFEGRKIKDVFFFRNRLGFLADESVIMSRTGNFFDFFRESSIQTLDTDPIDVGTSHVKVSILQHAVPFNESLLLFSDQTQFQLNRTETLTPRTAGFNVATEYECSIDAKPVGVGTNVYFAVNRGGFTSIREYYQDWDTQATDANDVTSHVPTYIPSDVSKLTATPNEETLIAFSPKDNKTLYIYKYYFDVQEKIQSSWSKWTFDAPILNTEFIESTLIVVLQREDGVYIESLAVEPGRREPAILDRRITNDQMTLTYDPTEDRTEIYVNDYMRASEDTLDQWQLIARNETNTKLYEVLDWEDDPAGYTVFYVEGDRTQEDLWLGKKFTLRYKFSQFFLREEAPGGGVQSISSGRLQVRRLRITTGPSGFFNVIVRPRGTNTYTYPFTGNILGQSQVGQVNLRETDFDVPVRSKNTEVEIWVENDSWLPCQLLSAEWKGYYIRKSSRT